jgi:phospholipid/cholesterol/gamma-HCH transport system permease protein
MTAASLVALTGRQTLWLWRELHELLLLLKRTVLTMVRRRVDRRSVVRFAFAFTNESLFFVALTLGFVGMIMTFQACFQAQRILGDMTLIGPGFLQLVVREFGPTIGGLMLATRVGAGIAAELGSMTVTEQIEALRMNGADPIHYLVVPRVYAGIVSMLCLGILGAAVMYATGGLTAMLAFDVGAKTFFDVRMVRWLDVVSFLHKCAVYGVAIPLVAARAGLSARGGSEGVGSATTRAVIECSLWILVFDLGIGAFYFMLGRVL